MLKTSRKHYISFILSAGFIVYAGFFFSQSCKNPAGFKAFSPQGQNTFVGPETCKSCHAEEYTQWLHSDHFQSMLEANDTTVLGNFNDQELSADGVTSKYFRRDGKYFINTEGPDGKNHDYPVKYTFGYFPLQQYLVEFPGGKMQVPRDSWDVKNKKWYHQYAGQKIDHNDWLHWTHAAQNWNSMCAVCHSTNLQKNYIAESDSFHTTWSVINVSCESCHGPGKNHVDYIHSDSYKGGEKTKGSYIALLKSDTNVVQLNACAICHARRTEISQHFIHSDIMLDNLIPQLPTTESYFADGQIKDEDYEYGSFTQSLMFHKGIKCSNCHNPHSGKIVKTGNALCLQCHQPVYNEITHTHHEAGSEGSKCINCHMPSKYYMGVDLRRDHSLRVPRPDLSAKYGTPNACNDCHTDKNAQWASDAVIKWFGAERKYHFSEDLIPGSMGNSGSESHLAKLINNTATPSIIRATALYYLSLDQSQPDISLFKSSMKSDVPLLRYEAVAAMDIFPAKLWAGDAAALLNDPVRAVRMQSANVLSTTTDDVFDKSSSPLFQSAKNEYMDYLHYQQDFTTGNIMLGDYYYKTRDYVQAEKYYLRSIEMDSLANYSRLNLATMYNAQKRNQDALQMLEKAIEVDPTNGRAYYLLALLEYELGDKMKAENNFDRALKNNYLLPEVYYNYALLLMQKPDYRSAETILKQGLALQPDAEILNYCIALVYIKTDRYDDALPYVKKLKEMDPGNANYQQLFNALSL